jgi:hypothetical protein
VAGDNYPEVAARQAGRGGNFRVVGMTYLLVRRRSVRTQDCAVCRGTW